MRYLGLLFLLVICIHFANAQNNNWFKGTWYGTKSFTGARLGIRAPVRIEIDSLYGEQFSGRFIYMYPKDTIARLIKTFTGNIKGYFIRLNISEEMFLLDPRSRSFWRNCAPCSETGSFTLNDSTIVFKITTGNCGDSCNGESVFAKKLIHYRDTLDRAEIAHFFSQDTSGIATGEKTKKARDNHIKNDLAAAKNKQLSLKNNKLVLENVTVAGAPNWVSGSNETITLPKDQTNNNSSSDDAIKNYSMADTGHKNLNYKGESLNGTNSNKERVAILNAAKVADSLSNAPGKTQPGVLSTADTDAAMEEKINRETTLINSYEFDTPHINVDLFDNGTIDSDAVSVYCNGKLVVNNAMLSYKAVSFSIDASANNRHLEFILIAENEGSVPPNSALMRITAGKKQFKLFISTSVTKNAKITIDYTGP